jgi:hypothetical protein
MSGFRRKFLYTCCVCAALTMGLGCSDDAPPAQGQISGNNGTPDPNNGEVPDNNGVEERPNVLSHDSDQATALVANSSVTLKVRYADADGNRLPDQGVRWEIIGEPNGARLEARSSNTDSLGVASMVIFSDVEEAIFEVEASVNDPDVSPIRFSVSVESKDFASYQVVVDYAGSRDYSNKEIKVALYEAPETCVEFDPLRPGTAEQSQKRPLDARGFPLNFTFTNLRNGTRYTAVATALTIEDGQDVVIGSWGCSDERPLIENGQNPEPVQIQMMDVLPDVTGTWSVNSRFNLSEALPPNVRQIVDPILELFSDPASFLSGYITRFIQEQFDLDSGSIQTVVDGIIQDVLESLIGANETVENILVGGGDIAEAIRNFNLIGTVAIEPEDISANGLIEGADLVYNTIGYRWRLNCDSDQDYERDPSCGDDFVSLGGFGSGSVPLIEAQWSGAIVSNGDYDPSRGRSWFHELSVEDHTIDFNYGLIILFLIEKVALPQLFPAENGMPAVNSLNGLLARFVRCEELFDNNTLQSVCEAAIDGLSDLVRGQLSDLEFGSDNFTLGTPDSKPCGLYEQMENYGSPAPNVAHFPRFSRMGLEEADNVDFGDLRCQWGATIQWSADPNDQSNASGRWFGTRAQ